MYLFQIISLKNFVGVFLGFRFFVSIFLIGLGILFFVFESTELYLKENVDESCYQQVKMGPRGRGREEKSMQFLI